MIERLPALHLVAGIVTIAAFLFTGYYMRTHFPAAYQSNEAIRYLFRASHIYILFAGLLNLILGSHMALAAAGWRRTTQLTGSTFLLVAPVVLLWAFFVEPPRASPHRPRTLAGVVLAATGTVLHAVARPRR